MTSEQLEKKKEFIENQVKFIKSQGFHSVRLFATLHDSEEEVTHSYTNGRGNVQAQIGHVRDWLIRQDEYVRVDARKDVNS